VAAARPDAIGHPMTAISMTHAGKPGIQHPSGRPGFRASLTMEDCAG
jgi:hypothetical protein